MPKTTLLLAALAALTFVGLGSDEAVSAIPKASFEQRAHSSGSHEQFRWPARAQFEQRLQGGGRARSVTLLQGQVRVAWGEGIAAMGDAELLAAMASASEDLKGKTLPNVVIGVSRAGGGEVFYVASLSSDDDSYIASSILGQAPAEAFADARAGRPVLSRHGEHALLFDPSRVWESREAEPTALADWTYVAALVQRERALYDTRNGSADSLSRDGDRGLAASYEEARAEGSEAALAFARDLVDDPPHPSSSTLEAAARLAAEQGDLALAKQLRALYRPVGQCSMDTRPQAAAAAYADLCYDAGDLACFLQLQVQIMGQQFSRMAYSSYGDAAHGSQVDRLSRTGVDPLGFLLGLLVEFDLGEKRPVAISPWRLARALVEGGFEGRAEAALAERAKDERLDPYNRLRATMTLAYMRIQAAPAFGDGEERHRMEELRSQLEVLRLHPLARAWVEALR